MRQYQLSRVADILVNHSIKAKEGELIEVHVADLGIPLATHVYRQLLDIGAHPIVVITDDKFGKIFYDYAKTDQLTHIPKYSLIKAKELDGSIGIYGERNPDALKDCDISKIMTRSKAGKKVSDITHSKKWVITNYPTTGLAKNAGMTLKEYTKFYYNAININYRELTAINERLKVVGDKAKDVKITDIDADLTFSIAGRVGISCDGSYNIPDGEVFYTPIKESVNGYIRYTTPTVKYGKKFDKVELVFKDGKVVKAKASYKGKNKTKELETILDTDAGSRYLGEFGIGTNPNIKEFTTDILFDEKVKGTIHLALGQSYKEAGKDNDSAIHWDLIKTFSPEGMVLLDGVNIISNEKLNVIGGSDGE